MRGPVLSFPNEGTPGGELISRRPLFPSDFSPYSKKSEDAHLQNFNGQSRVTDVDIDVHNGRCEGSKFCNVPVDTMRLFWVVAESYAIQRSSEKGTRHGWAFALLVMDGEDGIVLLFEISTEYCERSMLTGASEGNQ